MSKNLLTISALALLCLLAACGGPSDSPTTLRDAYVQALKDKNVDQILALSSKKYNERIAKAKENDPESVEKNFDFMCRMFLANMEGATVSDPEITEDKAVIHYKKGYVTFSLKMVKEDGKWCMDKGSLKDETPLEEQTPAVAPETPANTETPAK